jgi:hypothetical protein
MFEVSELGAVRDGEGLTGFLTACEECSNLGVRDSCPTPLHGIKGYDKKATHAGLGGINNQ